MAEIVTMGEMIVEIMRTAVGEELDRPGTFRGPFPSGAPAIFADTAARLGHRAGIIGSVGTDDFGKCLLNRLESDGVDLRNVHISAQMPTGCAFVTYFADGSRKFIFHIGHTAAVEVPAPAPGTLAGTKYFHIMGCSLMADPAFGTRIVQTMQKAAALGALVSFDPNIRPELLTHPAVGKLIRSVMEQMHVYLPGVGELLQFSGKPTVEAAVEACFEMPNLQIIAVKDGSRGCRVFTRAGETRNQGVYETETVDATGAGDCFDAAFLCGLLEGRDLADAAKMASAAAALNVAAFGPMEGRISRERVETMIREA